MCLLQKSFKAMLRTGISSSLSSYMPVCFGFWKQDGPLLYSKSNLYTNIKLHKIAKKNYAETNVGIKEGHMLYWTLDIRSVLLKMLCYISGRVGGWLLVLAT